MPLATFRAQACLGATRQQLDVEPGERLLAACLRQGVAVPYGCVTGTCGTCRAELIEGEISDLWPAAPGRSRNPREFLLCQSTPRSNVVFSVRKHEPACASLPGYHKGIVTCRRQVGREVIEVGMALASPVHFNAGQFFTIDMTGVEGWRALSVCESATQATAHLTFIVKEKAGGAMTTLLRKPSIVGRPARLFGPLGVATYRPDQDRDLICVVASSGLSVALSVLSTALEHGHFERHQATLIFSVQSASHLFYIDRLRSLALKANGAIALKVALSHPDGDTPAALPVHHGFAHEVLSQTDVNPDATAFVAGPPAMVQACLRTLIVQKRLPAQAVRYDSFA